MVTENQHFRVLFSYGNLLASFGYEMEPTKEL